MFDIHRWMVGCIFYFFGRDGGRRRSPLHHRHFLRSDGPSGPHDGLRLPGGPLIQVSGRRQRGRRPGSCTTQQRGLSPRALVNYRSVVIKMRLLNWVIAPPLRRRLNQIIGLIEKATNHSSLLYLCQPHVAVVKYERIWLELLKDKICKTLCYFVVSTTSSLAN